ncbi:MAG: hypothetical protein A2Z25_21230 [Planctomycetes bacterium RBG_16_55_9]|nr:MAG: hypothetical protein A2Z25_21230 [Planctomycetes bacterium RBG_16_55_9]
MKPHKTFDCIEMKRKIQEKIYEDTKNFSREELIAYFRHHAQTGPFAQLWKKSPKQKRPMIPRQRQKS